MSHTEAIRSANVAKAGKEQWLTGNRQNRKRLTWIKGKLLAGNSVSEAEICEKWKMPHVDFLKVIPLRLVGDGSINLTSVCRLNSVIDMYCVLERLKQVITWRFGMD